MGKQSGNYDTRGGGGKPEDHGEHMYLKLHSLESKLGTLTSGRKPRGWVLYVPVIAFVRKIPEMLMKGILFRITVEAAEGR